MPSLSLDFQILFDFSKNQIVLTDTSNYPIGVAEGITGIFSVKQPDKTTVSGKFESPDIYHNGVGLAKGIKKLRLTSNNEPQRGTYIITYKVRHDDYYESTLVREVDLNYNRPELDIKKEFDVYTPSLFVEDNTIYNAPGYIVIAQSREWNITVGSVGNIVSSEKRADLAYNGNYYDARYIISLKCELLYKLTNPTAGFVEIKDFVEASRIYTANTPIPYVELLALLNTIKEVEDGNCEPKASGCGCQKGDYSKASTLYNHIKQRICGFDTVELYSYLEEFLSIYYSHVPGYTNTNTIIQPYDRSFCATDSDNPGGGEDTGLPDDLEFIIGLTPGGPEPGSTVYINPALAGWNIRLYISRLKQTKLVDFDGVGFIKFTDSNQIQLIGQKFEAGSLLQIEFVSGIKGSNVSGGVNQVQTNWSQNNPAAPDYLKNKPLTFPPAAHTHAVNEVQELSNLLANKSDKAHIHSIGEVSGLSGALGSKASSNHGHSISDIDGLAEALGNSSGGMFTGTVTVSESKTLNANDVNKIHQIRGSNASYIIGLPSLSELSVNGFYPIESLYDNKAQSKIIAASGEYIYHNGKFNNYIWLGVGEYVWLYRASAGWFVLADSIPRNIGMPFLTYKLQDNQFALDGEIVPRANTAPRLWETVSNFGNNILIDDSLWLTDTVTTTAGIVIPRPYRGCYSRGNGSSTFRLPDFRKAFVRGLASFGNTASVDVTRAHNHAGGFQLHAFQQHTHFTVTKGQTTNDKHPFERGKDIRKDNSILEIYSKSSGQGKESYSLEGVFQEPNAGLTSKAGDPTETRVDNIGMIWAINY